jgi:uncharacterized protein (DUF1330 family)
MAAFVVAMVQEPPAGPDAMIPYREQIESTLAPYGGRYRVAAGQRMEVMEGEWRPSGGLVIIEFPSYAQAQAWYHSPEYAPLLALRQSHVRLDLILAEGLADGETMLAHLSSAKGRPETQTS